MFKNEERKQELQTMPDENWEVKSLKRPHPTATASTPPNSSLILQNGV
jgi:hypothetical protein